MLIKPVHFHFVLLPQGHTWIVELTVNTQRADTGQSYSRGQLIINRYERDMERGEDTHTALSSLLNSERIAF